MHNLHHHYDNISISSYSKTSNISIEERCPQWEDMYVVHCSVSKCHCVFLTGIDVRIITLYFGNGRINNKSSGETPIVMAFWIILIAVDLTILYNLIYKLIITVCLQPPNPAITRTAKNSKRGKKSSRFLSFSCWTVCNMLQSMSKMSNEDNVLEEHVDDYCKHCFCLISPPHPPPGGRGV